MKVLHQIYAKSYRAWGKQTFIWSNFIQIRCTDNYTEIFRQQIHQKPQTPVAPGVSI